ncbi:MAG TPA: CsgG/HfaB family protein [Sphingopyxis sp.]|nr:CsgG/HfaB family protein [Sphingopyxis sp.]HMP44256.1 CsgG/HfaB family protein [Sphingopyxis sp.]HMQ18994.1 CsgG/HfaB family protein [Sphingopyxis sp.]
MAFGNAAAAQGTRPIVGIYEMEDLTGNGQAQTFSTMIETAITATNKFRVIERSGLNKLLREQGGARTGLTTTNRPGRVGGFEGVDYLVYGTITAISAKQKSNVGANFLNSLGGNNNPGCSNVIASLEADIKITDANTGEVRYVTRVSEIQQGATSCGTAGQIDTAALLRGAADKIASGLVTTIYPIQVAAVQPDGIFVLNYGEGSVTAGATMTVFEKGAAIVDPATGEVIASNEIKLGLIEITDVQTRFSKARAVTPFSYTPPVGAIVRLATPDDRAEFRSSGKGKRK